VLERRGALVALSDVRGGARQLLRLPGESQRRRKTLAKEDAVGTLARATQMSTAHNALARGSLLLLTASAPRFLVRSTRIRLTAPFRNESLRSAGVNKAGVNNAGVNKVLAVWRKQGWRKQGDVSGLA
jgi:hypothetical protein